MNHETPVAGADGSDRGRDSARFYEANRLRAYWPRRAARIYEVQFIERTSR